MWVRLDTALSQLEARLCTLKQSRLQITRLSSIF